jgi:hypothetical protein
MLLSTNGAAADDHDDDDHDDESAFIRGDDCKCVMKQTNSLTWKSSTRTFVSVWHFEREREREKERERERESERKVCVALCLDKQTSTETFVCESHREKGDLGGPSR